MIQSFSPMSAEANYSTQTLTVNFIAGFNQYFHNREEAQATLGFPCQFSSSDYKQFKKSGWTIIRLDMGGQIINPK
jgi:hypothetical protein